MVLHAPVNSPASRPVKDSPIEVTGKYKSMPPAQPASAQKAPSTKPAMPATPAQQPTKAAVASTAATGGVLPEAQKAIIQILTGPNAGKELELVKNLTTLGKPGVQVAVLTRRPHGYFITYVEGATYPMVNAKLLDDQPKQLAEHDIIELAGIKMEFYFKN